jgi:hypothetical protein
VSEEDRGLLGLWPSLRVNSPILRAHLSVSAKTGQEVDDGIDVSCGDFDEIKYLVCTCPGLSESTGKRQSSTEVEDGVRRCIRRHGSFDGPLRGNSP